MLLPHVTFDCASGREKLTESDAVQASIPSNAVIEITRFETCLRRSQRHRQFGLITARQGVDRLRLSVRIPAFACVLSAQILFGAQETGFILGDRAVYD